MPYLIYCGWDLNRSGENAKTRNQYGKQIVSFLATSNRGLLKHDPSVKASESPKKNAMGTAIFSYDETISSKVIPSDLASKSVRLNTISPNVFLKYYQVDLTNQQRKKERLIKNWQIYLSTFLLFGCSTLKQTNCNPITEIPKEIQVRYITDIVSNKASALKIAEVLFTEECQIQILKFINHSK